MLGRFSAHLSAFRDRRARRLPATKLDRRDLLCAGGAAALSAMVTALLGRSKPVRAQAITGPVPEIDRLAVWVVIDSYQFAVAPSKMVSEVDVQHFGWGIGSEKPPGRTLISEFGLSMHAESQRGGETRNILMDFGFTPEALVSNVDLGRHHRYAATSARLTARPWRTRTLLWPSPRGRRSSPITPSPRAGSG
jgi:hypothetical protein